ncbi:hypothetical protein ANN_03225 [Periplaneta americana]|uniref:Uncharacterized protein n=1 Tax=Periplaneta americana TaxID=6978 RepID=A0ABQ8TYF1_PERAM|nr:hypothetical protein ANN_03225 [Periplaneta americana]
MGKRRFNKPTVSEIAGVFNSLEREPPGNRHVVVHNRQDGPKLLSVLSPHSDPMLYPLLFPYGDTGWDPQMTHNGPRRQRKRDRLKEWSYRIGSSLDKHLPNGGTTLHRLFGLPVPITSSLVSCIKANSERAKVLREVSIILTNEASMIPAVAVDCMDRLCMGPVPTQHRDALGERNPVTQTSYNGWEAHRANNTIPPFWLDDRPPLLRHVAVRPAAG